MSTDAFQRLRRAHPAAAMPPDDEDARERLRRAIIATPLEPKAAARRRRRLRPATLVFVSGAVLLLGAGAVYAKTVLLTPINKGPNPPITAAQWRAEYTYWTRQIPLPAGVHWLPSRDVNTSGAVRGSGHFDAVLQGIGDWSVAWLWAAADGDKAGVAGARTWVERLSATIPTITPADEKRAFHSKYGTESMLGYGGLDRSVAAARHGHFVLLVDRAAPFGNWGLSRVKHENVNDPGQAHEVAWAWTLDGATPSDTDSGLQNPPAVSQARALAEGEAVIDTVGQPAGLDLASGLFDGIPPGFDAASFPPGALAEDYQHYLGDIFKETFTKLWVAWWTEWVAAAKAGDRQGVAAAASATALLESVLPARLTIDGHIMTVDLAATPAGRDLHDIAAQARAGDLSAMKAWLAFEHAYWTLRLDWRGANVWLDACGGVLYPVSWSVTDASRVLPKAGLAFERTTERQWLACWRAWLAAIAAGDAQEAATEARASQALRDRMANGWPAGGGARVALSPATMRQFDRLAARARHGDPNGLQDWLVYQVLYETEIGKMALARTAG